MGINKKKNTSTTGSRFLLKPLKDACLLPIRVTKWKHCKILSNFEIARYCSSEITRKPHFGNPTHSGLQYKHVFHACPCQPVCFVKQTEL